MYPCKIKSINLKNKTRISKDDPVGHKTRHEIEIRTWQEEEWGLGLRDKRGQRDECDQSVFYTYMKLSVREGRGRSVARRHFIYI